VVPPLGRAYAGVLYGVRSSQLSGGRASVAGKHVSPCERHPHAAYCAAAKELDWPPRLDGASGPRATLCAQRNPYTALLVARNPQDRGRVHALYGRSQLVRGPAVNRRAYCVRRGMATDRIRSVLSPWRVRRPGWRTLTANESLPTRVIPTAHRGSGTSATSAATAATSTIPTIRQPMPRLVCHASTAVVSKVHLPSMQRLCYRMRPLASAGAAFAIAELSAASARMPVMV